MSDDPINSTDLGFVRQQLVVRHGWTKEVAEATEARYRMMLRALRSHDSRTQQIRLSPEVAFFWQTHILHTLEYHDFCAAAFGRYMPYLFTLDSEIADAVDSLDFSFIRRRLMNPLGKAWPAQRVDAAERGYRQFLYLVATQPPSPAISPEADVDEFWHLHILDHARYEADCQRIFGGYLDHIPTEPQRMEADDERMALAGA